MIDETAIDLAELTSFDSETVEGMDKAKQVAEALTKHYPNFPWAVGFAPGMTLVVKCMAIDDGRYGFTIDGAKSFSASDLAHQAMLAGGELLERCGVDRGQWDGQFLNLKHKD